MQRGVQERLLILQDLNREINRNAYTGELTADGQAIEMLCEINLNSTQRSLCKADKTPDMRLLSLEIANEAREEHKQIYCIDEEVCAMNNYKRLIRRNQLTGDTREQVVQNYNRTTAYDYDEDRRETNKFRQRLQNEVADWSWSTEKEIALAV